MKSSITPIVKDLVLIGGGHSHAIALKMLGMHPMPGVRLTLITDVYHTPYSGMLPGYVAGLYRYDECHIDLRPLSQFAQTRLIVDRAIALDLEKNQVLCANHPPISFDILSLDIGSTPATVTVPGAKEYAIPVKPISKFLTYWEQLMDELGSISPLSKGGRRPETTDSSASLRLGIVGGGAGGVELALSVQARLARMQPHSATPKQPAKIHLFHRGPELLPERHPRMRRLFQRMMVNRDIQIHLNDEVVALEPVSVLSQRDQQGLKGVDGKEALDAVNVIAKSGNTVECDRVFWVTSASAAHWVAQSGLATDNRGFLQVNDYLQSVSHPQVFAAGDIASMVNHPRPKAGVFAVRQGMPLYENLCRAVQNHPLKPFNPQKEFLILVGTGYEKAIASRGSLSIGPSKLIWQWKDHIDRKFMDRFSNLVPMGEAEGQRGRGAEGQRGRGAEKQRGREAERQKGREAEGQRGREAEETGRWGDGETGRRGEGKTGRRGDGKTGRRGDGEMGRWGDGEMGRWGSPIQHPKSNIQNFLPCSGCASKVGKSVLDQVLRQFKRADSSILIGLDSVDDAAVVQVPSGMVLVQTVDYFRALLDDPFLVGQITTHHCLNDLYAMGANPHSAMAIATLPYAIPVKQENTLYLLLSGVVQILSEAGAQLVGGHTVEGTELGLGLSCNGFAVPDQLWRKGGMQPGDQLILTKALGTGTLFAADMQLRAKGRWIEGAIASMLQSNQPAAACLKHHGATACTDVSGFGLAGHLLEMVTASAQSVALTLDAIQPLSGAIATLEQFFFSSLYPENRKAERDMVVDPQMQNHAVYPLLFDPQTAGGLLASVPNNQVTACVTDLKALGYGATQIIGHIKNAEQGTKDIATRDVIPKLYVG